MLWKIFARNWWSLKKRRAQLAFPGLSTVSVCLLLYNGKKKKKKSCDQNSKPHNFIPVQWLRRSVTICTASPWKKAVFACFAATRTLNNIPQFTPRHIYSLVQWNWFSLHWMHVTQVHPVTSENQFHCNRLYTRPFPVVNKPLERRFVTVTDPHVSQLQVSLRMQFRNCHRARSNNITSGNDLWKWTWDNSFSEIQQRCPCTNQVYEIFEENQWSVCELRLSCWLFWRKRTGETANEQEQMKRAIGRCACMRACVYVSVCVCVCVCVRVSMSMCAGGWRVVPHVNNTVSRQSNTNRSSLMPTVTFALLAVLVGFSSSFVQRVTRVVQVVRVFVFHAGILGEFLYVLVRIINHQRVSEPCQKKKEKKKKEMKLIMKKQREAIIWNSEGKAVVSLT